MTNLEPTGERLIEEHYRTTAGGYFIYLMHSASYRLAEPYCRGARVLDLGCGSGYGAARIAASAAIVHAVDVAADAVAYASDHYARSNLTFAQIEPGARLPFSDASFDVVLSFQVIEHVADDRGYLAEAARVLVPGGVLILITPDRKHRLLPGQKPWNRWHLREYDGVWLRKLVEQRFRVREDLRMGARGHAADSEFARYRRLKWLTLPFTLPFVPEDWRRRGLDLLHRLRGEPKPGPVAAAEPAYGDEVVEFASDIERSLNLIMIATPRDAAPTP